MFNKLCKQFYAKDNSKTFRFFRCSNSSLHIQHTYLTSQLNIYNRIYQISYHQIHFINRTQWSCFQISAISVPNLNLFVATLNQHQRLLMIQNDIQLFRHGSQVPCCSRKKETSTTTTTTTSTATANNLNSMEKTVSTNDPSLIQRGLNDRNLTNMTIKCHTLALCFFNIIKLKYTVLFILIYLRLLIKILLSVFNHIKVSNLTNMEDWTLSEYGKNATMWRNRYDQIRLPVNRIFLNLSSYISELLMLCSVNTRRDKVNSSRSEISWWHENWLFLHGTTFTRVISPYLIRGR